MLSGLAAELLERCRFPGHGEKLDCAVSGGKDSLALLILAVAAGCETTAYHVDHQLREGSAGESAIVEKAAGALGARFVSLQVECEPGPNLEARARAARRAVLPQGVATGHTADDQAETILINLLRGSGLDGLSGMRFGPQHPILKLRRKEAADLVQEMGFSYVEDPSNADLALLRNRVRHELLPVLSAAAQRDLVPILCRQAELFASEADLLDELASAVPVQQARELASAPAALARRSIRLWLEANSSDGYPPSSAAIERVLSVARGEVRATELPGGRRLSRHRGELVLGAPDALGRGDAPDV